MNNEKISLSTDTIEQIYSPIILNENQFRELFKKVQPKIASLFIPYQKIMERLYSKLSPLEIEGLFIKHTLLQMIISACVTAALDIPSTAVEACLGQRLEIAIVLPYLKWWESILTDPGNSSDRNFLEELTESIYSKTQMLDWHKGSKEDIFRTLYENFIKPDTRRKLGEYYTPIWLAEYMIERLISDGQSIKNQVVLDPFCGSGTFLIATFYKKIHDGKLPGDAIKEIIGFDINPLAVSIARAELLVAYHSITTKVAIPLVFTIDSATLLLNAPSDSIFTDQLGEIQELEKKLDFIKTPFFPASKTDFFEIPKIEMFLHKVLKKAIGMSDIKNKLTIEFRKVKEEYLDNTLMKQILETISTDKSIIAITNLLEKYGDGVWAILISSLYAPYIIQKLKVDIILSNPPWNQLTEPKGNYGNLLRKIAKKLLKNYNKTGQILNGSDISSLLLYGCKKIVQKEAAVLIPMEVGYHANSYYGLGKILTFEAVKGKKGEIDQIRFDVFQNGRPPCIVFLSKEPGTISCSSLNLSVQGSYSKNISYSELTVKKSGREQYQNYMKRIIEYTNIPTEFLRTNLMVDEVASQGNLIRGLFGGSVKSDVKKFAGMIFNIMDFDETKGQYTIKLMNINTPIHIQKDKLEKFWTKLIYGWDFFQFYIYRIHHLLLSSHKKENLIRFLEVTILKHLSDETERNMVFSLMRSLKQPESPTFLTGDRYIVAYRSHRAFISVVISPKDILKLTKNGSHKLVISDIASYLATKDEQIAYYYATVLNYLAYKGYQKQGAFERRQFTRPLITLIESGLEWRKKDWQLQIAQFGKQLHELTPSCFDGFVTRGKRIKDCFTQLESCENTKDPFKTILQLIDKEVDQDKLNQALKYVCSF